MGSDEEAERQGLGAWALCDQVSRELLEGVDTFFFWMNRKFIDTIDMH